MKGEIDIGSGILKDVLHLLSPRVNKENVTIINKYHIFSYSTQKNIHNIYINNYSRQPTPLIIGDENVFEVGCYVEGSKIGNKNIIEAKARVLGNTSLGDNCVIGAVCSTKKDEAIPNNTVIYGDHHNRRTQTASGG
ncbi:2591_t:CDS:2, partial [Gigaspora margarita]